jgi:ergothioneine biosynthesis protein EgtB
MTQKTLIARFQQVRQATLHICSHIETEDFVVQPNPEVSPPKWHLGHTTWFFETIILQQYKANYQRFNDAYPVLFNSYYKAAGTHTSQSERGNLSRPTVAEIMRYRAYVDDAITALLTETTITHEIATLMETGFHHEQQHQELLYMDIKAILANNVLTTPYVTIPLASAPLPTPTTAWMNIEEGLVEIGHDGKHFSYDNERPRYKHYLYPVAVSQHLVSNGEFLAFMQDSGYCKAQYWLSQGWDWVNETETHHPLYWSMRDGEWFEYTLHGLEPLDLNRPLVHISYFEADAFAKWKNLRLPTEQELEIYLNHSTAEPVHQTDQCYHPTNPQAAEQVWCWTSSQYSPYPRFKAFDGLLNEYNGKFMCNQFVLRGGCIITPQHHYRHSYRNFYLPHQRWMFSGIRLAKDIL